MDQQLKPAQPPIEQFLTNLYYGGIEEVLPRELRNDPTFQAILSAVVPQDDIDKAASLFGGPIPKLTRQGIKMVSRNIPNIVTNDLGEATAKVISSNPVYHGGPSGIRTLRLPTDEKGLNVPSTGGIYTVVDPTDVRLIDFSRGGSVYNIKPNLNRTLNVQNIQDLPKQERKFLEQQIDRLRGTDDPIGKINRVPSRISDEQTAYNLFRMISPETSGSRYVSSFSEELADMFKRLDYDSIAFPKRAIKGESETIVTFDPKKLTIKDEIPQKDYDKFVIDFDK